MKRRTLFKTAALAVLGNAVPRAARAQAGSLNQDDREMLAAIAEAVLPSTLGGDGRDKAVEAFVRWLDGYKAGVPMSFGYGGQLKYEVVPPSPLPRYSAQFSRLQELSEARGSTFKALAPGERKAVVEAALIEAKVTRLPARPDGQHIAARPGIPASTSRGPQGDSGGHGSFAALRHYPQLWFAVAANVCNVGAQISVWSNIIFYMKSYTRVDEKTAANYIVYSLVAMLAGRFITTPIMKHVAPNKLLGVYGAINVLLMAITVARPGMLGAWTIVASSFFLGIMFPTIFALGLKGLGENTKLAGSMLVMAIVGGAFFPLVLGWISRTTGSMALAYLVPLGCFAGVSLYGFCAPLILPPPGNTDPEAGALVAEFGQGF